MEVPDDKMEEHGKMHKEEAKEDKHEHGSHDHDHNHNE